MGRRQSRKRERRAVRQERLRAESNFYAPVDVGEPTLPAILPTPPQLVSCGRCREFIEDAEGGRGTCLHPGSGILAPWTDTPGCDFFARRR